MKTLTKIVGIALIIWGNGISAAEFDHSAWDALLVANVVQVREGHATQVDYSAMLESRHELTKYLNSLATVERAHFEQWAYSAQLAFLINAYNAWTVDFVLTQYPNIESIKDLGSFFSSPWSKDIVSLFGEQVSLDDIEHGMIRGWNRYNEPRIHFAVNCAAIGCPALAAKAFTAENLDALLETNTRLFLSDDTRNYYDGGRFYLSRIFDWYEEDFEKGWGGYNSLSAFLAAYQSELNLPPDAIDALASESIRIRYTDYDWGLNRKP